MRDSLLPRVRALVFTLCVLPAMGLVAPGTALAETCPNAQFRVGPSLHLPDCRAYELVTPPFKEGDASTESYGISQNGEAVGYSSDESFVGAGANEGLFAVDRYVAQRTEAGWVSTSLTPRASEFFSAAYEGFGTYDFTGTPNQLTHGWYLRGLTQRENEIDLYLFNANGSYIDFGPVLPPTAPDGPPVVASNDGGAESDGIAGGYEVKALSADGSHVVFELGGSAGSPVAEWPFAGPGALLEYIGAGNTTPLLLGVEDNGKFIDECPTQQITGLSADGSIAVLTDSCDNQLYARVDNGQPGAHTVAISEPSLEDCAACDTAKEVRKPAQTDAMPEDGSKVFFTTSQPLLGGRAEEDIYEYDFDAPAGQRVVRVTAGDATVSDPAVELKSLVTISKDGSHVYFVAGGVLTKTPNCRGEVAQPGADNLYFYEHDGQYPAGRTVFVAALDGVSGAETTPDGQFLVFSNGANLTSDSASGGAYEYDSQANTMVRVSKGQNGYNDDGNGAGISSLVVSGNGSYVFFQSSDGLTPQALNNVSSGGVTAQNVYEYHDGSVSLISDGQDIADVPFGFGSYKSSVTLIGTDSSGDNVFFTTEDQLVPQDTNTTVDLYDARVDGGFPPPPAAPECQGDACQGQLGAAPVLLSPGSEFQAGGEDFQVEEPKVSGSSKTTSAPKSKQKKKKKKKVKAKVKRGRKAGRVSRVRVSGGGNGGRS
jgi:hypothetical protein